MKKESFDFLKELISAVSPSGFEEEAVKVWRDRTKSFADEVTVDVLGNATAVLNKVGGLKIMLAGHVDEIGYMVKYIDDAGFIYFSAIGGIDTHLIPGQRVWIKNGKNNVLGVIGKKPVHQLDDEERKKLAKIEELWIDIGARGRKEARSRVDVGDAVVPAVGLEILHDDLVVGRGFDDKAGAFVISETLRLLSRERLKSSLYGVATVQEELGLRGAKASAYGISPDVGIAIDVTFATDFPSMDKRKIGDIRLGSGPVIARGPNINPKIFDLLVEAAEKEKIPYQVEGISRATGTDANVIQMTKAGVATGLVSIPNRYMHTQVEVISLNDLENAAKLLSAFALSLDRKTDFIPRTPLR